MDSFVTNALIAGIGVAIVAGSLGTIVVWRRMSYFGDALSHSALLGIAISLWLDINTMFGIVGFSIFFSILVVTLDNQKMFSRDTLLGITAHSSLALGIVSSSLLGINVDLESYLFGNILAVTGEDINIIIASTVAIVIALTVIWKKILFITVHRDLAFTQNINIKRNELYFMILLSLLVAIAIKIVGVLLITSLLIIPAAAARKFSNTPEIMAIFSVIIGVLSVIVGILFSFEVDTPTGPTIVLAAALIFICVMVYGAIFRKEA